MLPAPALLDISPRTNAVLTWRTNVRPRFASALLADWESKIARRMEDIAVLSNASTMDCKVASIRQKFAGLRMYLDIDDASTGLLEIVEEAATHTHLRTSSKPASVRARAAAIVDAATTRCSTQCEMCGNEGRRRNSSGWLHVACDAHSATR